MSEQVNPLLKLASNVKLFMGMPMTLLSTLLSFADKVPIVNGDLFFDEGDVGESFYILVIGHVAVEQTKNGRWIQLASLHPGDSFGEMTLVDDKVRSARVRATTNCVALYFPVQRLRGQTEITSILYHNIAKILVKRLKTANNVVLDLSAKVASAEPHEEEGAAEGGEAGAAKDGEDAAKGGAKDMPKDAAKDAAPAVPEDESGEDSDILTQAPIEGLPALGLRPSKF